ncbi:hypothetical protein Q9966_002790 [Columba livia]|nr:hypothetical protein Q9966_002790 [Columba livia]
MLLEVSWREKLPSLIVTRAMIDPDLCSCSPCGAFSNYFMFDRIDIFPINAIAMCSFGNHSELIVISFYIENQFLARILDDIPASGEPVSKSNHSRASARFPKLSRSQHREPRSLEPQSGDL